MAAVPYGFQSMQEMNPGAFETEYLVTLLVRHLPEAVTHDTLPPLLSHYGASYVRLCSTGRLRNCAFVDFKNEALASQAQRQFNGLRFLGKVLKVERASKLNEESKFKHNEAKTASLMKEATVIRGHSSRFKIRNSDSW